MKEKTFKSIPGKKKRKSMAFTDFSAQERARTLHLMNSIIHQICKIVLPFDPEGLWNAAIATKVEDGVLMKNVEKVINALPRNSVQSNVLLAPVCRAYDARLVKAKFNIGKIKLASLQRKFNHLASRSFVQPPIRSVQQFKKPDAEQAVRFILSYANVQRISWGTKKIMVNGEDVEIPKLIRKKIIVYMYRDYVETVPEGQRIGATSFKKIAHVLTATDQRAKKAVDYVSGILVQDNSLWLQQVVGTCAEASVLVKMLHALESFMKVTLEAHVLSCNVTSVEFAFSNTRCSPRTCEECTLPIQTITYMKSLVDEHHHGLLDEACQKSQLYLGHRVRIKISVLESMKLWITYRNKRQWL